MRGEIAVIMFQADWFPPAEAQGGMTSGVEPVRASMQALNVERNIMAIGGEDALQATRNLECLVKEISE